MLAERGQEEIENEWGRKNCGKFTVNALSLYANDKIETNGIAEH